MTVQTTIHKRLTRVHHLLALIVAASNHANSRTIDNGSSISEESIAEAIEAAASEAWDELYWVQRLEDSVGLLPAPTDEEVPEGCEPDEFLRAQMRELIDGEVTDETKQEGE